MSLLNHPAVQNQLRRKGRCCLLKFTGRKGSRPAKSPEVPTCQLPGYDLGKAEVLDPVLSCDLSRHVADSGFTCPRDWIEALFETAPQAWRTAEAVCLYSVHRKGSSPPVVEPTRTTRREMAKEVAPVEQDPFSEHVCEAEAGLRNGNESAAVSLLNEVIAGTRSAATRWQALDFACSEGMSAIKKLDYGRAVRIFAVALNASKRPAEGICRRLLQCVSVGRHVALGMDHWVKDDFARANLELQRGLSEAIRQNVSISRLFCGHAGYENNVLAQELCKILVFEKQIRTLVRCMDLVAFRAALTPLVRWKPLDNDSIILPRISGLGTSLHSYVIILNRICRGGFARSGRDVEPSTLWSIDGGEKEINELAGYWRSQRFTSRIQVLDGIEDSWKDLCDLMNKFPGESAVSEKEWRHMHELAKQYHNDDFGRDDADVALHHKAEECAQRKMDSIPPDYLAIWFREFHERSLLPSVPDNSSDRGDTGGDSQEHDTLRSPRREHVLPYHVMIDQYRSKKGMMIVTQKGTDWHKELRLDRVETEICLAMAREMKATKGKNIEWEDSGWVTYGRFKKCVSGWNSDTSDESIHKRIATIRKKLPKDRLPPKGLIEVQSGLGYRLAIPPQAIVIR